MKKTFLRRMVMIILIFCICAAHTTYFPLSQDRLAAADARPVSKPYYDEEGEYRFQYYDDEVVYRIQINIEELEWLSASGVMEKLYAEQGSLYVEIFAYRKGYVIPKEFINTMNRLRCGAYCFVKIGEEGYDWGLSPSSYFAEQDFSPYVTFSVPERYSDAYEEGTKYVQLQTQYDSEKSGFQAKLSIASFCLGGTKYTTSDYFQDFFERYSVDEIVEVDNDWRNYSYNLHNSVHGNTGYPEEIGYFHMTEFDDDGVKKRHWKEYNWVYRVNIVYPALTFANLEVHQMNNLAGGTFVLSDAAPITNANTYEPTPSPTPALTVSESPSPTPAPTDSPALTATPAPSNFPESTTTPIPSGTVPPMESPDSSETLQSTESPDPSESLPPMKSPDPSVAVLQTAPPKQNISEPQTGSLKKLTGMVTKDNKIKLKWSSNIPQGASKLVLYRKDSGKRSYVKIKNLSLSKRNYLDKKTDKGEKYTYKLLCVDSSDKCMKSMKAVSPTISVPYFAAPKMKLAAVSQDGERYLRVKISRYRGKYAEIYLSQNGKTYKKVPLKNLSISRYDGQFLLSYQKSMGQVYCKVRTWTVKKGKKKYSHYSAVKKIKLN